MKTLQQRLESAARELTEHVETSFDRPSFQPERKVVRLRRLSLVVATAAVFAVSLITIAVIAPFGSDLPLVDVPDPTTIPEPGVPVPESVTTEVVQTYVWTRVEDPDFGGAGEQVIESVRFTSTGLLAVGRDGERPAIWISEDGNEWARVDDPTGAFGPENSVYGEESVTWLHDVTEGGSRMVAVGIDLLDRSGVSNLEMNPKVKSMAFWYSDDGLTWTRVPHDEETFELGPGFIDNVRVVATYTGFIALGEAIWTSPDGETWNRQKAPGQYASDLIVTIDGLLLVGQDGSGDEYRPAAWYANDGIIWNAAGVEAADTGSDGSFVAAMATDQGYLALGPGSDTMVWFSPDGYTWTFRGGYTENDGYAYDRPNDIAALNGHVVAVGERLPHTGQGATIWESSDNGYTWKLFDDPNILGNARSEGRQSAAYSIIVFESQFVVGGRFGSSDDGGDAAIWIGVPND